MLCVLLTLAAEVTQHWNCIQGRQYYLLLRLMISCYVLLNNLCHMWHVVVLRCASVGENCFVNSSGSHFIEVDASLLDNRATAYADRILYGSQSHFQHGGLKKRWLVQVSMFAVRFCSQSVYSRSTADSTVVLLLALHLWITREV